VIDPNTKKDYLTEVKGGRFLQVENKFVKYPFPRGGYNSLDADFPLFFSNVLEFYKTPNFDILIPFNTGGHWVAVHIEMRETNVVIYHVNSCNGDGSSYLSGVIHFLTSGGRNVRIEERRCLMQTDGAACGVFTAEYIRNILKGSPLPDNKSMNSDDTLALRTEHLQMIEQQGDKLVGM
jgi:hypothetical protein